MVFICCFFTLSFRWNCRDKFLVELRPIHTWAIIKAHLSFYKNFYKFLKKRKNLQKKQNYNLHTSIVWQYFVLGRKRQFKEFKINL